MGTIDICLIRHFNSPSLFLFQAPGFSGIKKNDVVLCDTAIGVSVGKVIEILTVTEGSAEFDFAVTACSASLPLKKILAVGQFKELRWEND